MSTAPPVPAAVPRFENVATLALASIAATAMIDGQFAGRPTGLMRPGRLLSLPAAATMSVPRSSARLATVSYVVEKGSPGDVAPPRDIEITRQPLRSVQLM